MSTRSPHSYSMWRDAVEHFTQDFFIYRLSRVFRALDYVINYFITGIISDSSKMNSQQATNMDGGVLFHWQERQFLILPTHTHTLSCSSLHKPYTSITFKFLWEEKLTSTDQVVLTSISTHACTCTGVEYTNSCTHMYIDNHMDKDLNRVIV